MGVKTNLLGMTLTADDKSGAFTAGDDIAGLLQIVELRCSEMVVILTAVQNLMTAAGDSGNASTVGTQITALS